MNRCLVGLLLFTSSAVPNACLASPNGEATVVQDDDLDLSTRTALKALHRRIERAADQASAEASAPAAGQQSDLACIADAMAAAHAQVVQAIADQRQSKSPAFAEAKPH
jgi:UrcA family protein